MASNIAAGVKQALPLFDNISSLLKASISTSHKEAGKDIEKERSRFRIWAGNIGAHQTGGRSLQYRLRDASRLQEQVATLINDLVDTLQDAIDISSGAKVPWDQLESVGGDGDSAEEEPLPDEEDGDDLPTSELSQVARDIEDIVSCLLRLSTALRNPAPHDRFVAAHDTDTTSFEPWDTMHVRSKFSGVSDDLADRLGKAISDRRKYFNYRQSHHAKLSHGLQPEGLDGEGEGEKLEDAESTLASSLPTHIRSKLATVSLANIDEDELSDAGFSQTSFASSNADATKLCVPPLPEEAGKGPFECPLCFHMISASTTVAWRFV